MKVDCMNNIRNSHVAILVFVLLLFPSLLHASAGKTVFVLGKVEISSAGGGPNILKKGMDVKSGDKIVTRQKGQVMLKMSDGSKITVRPSSTLIVKAYKYTKSKKNDVAKYELLAGTFRAITGAIGKNNKKAFKLKTPVGTLGIRGTDFVASYSKDGFYVDVNKGGVSIANANGSMDVNPGNFGHIDVSGNPPLLVDQLPEDMIVIRKNKKDGRPASQEEEMVAIAIKYSDGDIPGTIDELIESDLPTKSILSGAETMGVDKTQVLEQVIVRSPDSVRLI